MCGTNFHNGGSYNRTVGLGSHFLCLLRGGDAEAYCTGNVLCSFYQLHHRSDIGGDLGSGSGYAKGGNAVYEAICLFCNPGDPVVGCGGDQGNQLQTILFADHIELLFFLKRYIRKNQSIHSNFCCFPDETLCSIGKNNVCVSHKYHWDTGFFTDFYHHVKDLVCGYSAAQCTHIGFLDHRTFCCRVGKRDSKLNKFCTCFLHCIDKLLSDLQRWISAGDKWDKCFSFCKCF